MKFRALVSTLFLGIVTSFAQQPRIVVEAGSRDYRHAITILSVPDTFPREGTLRSGTLSIPFQKNAEEQIVFIVPELTEHQRLIFETHSGTQEPTVSAEQREGAIHVASGGRPIFVYQGHESALPRSDIRPEFQRGGYIHPVYTPDGKVVTDDYPPNHIHHHGIWFPWTKTRFEGRTPDFWNMGEKKGKVDFVEFGETWSGPVHAGFAARHRFIDLTAPQPKAALDERWQVTTYAIPGEAGNYHVFDLVSTQTCATAAPLVLPKYHYGGLGYRGPREWDGAEACEFLTSNGETDRVKGNETRGKWCHIGGRVEDRFAGTAILCHPDNFRAPQPMRLHPNEPFFCFAPSQLGDWEISPGKAYVSRYRFVVKDGRPDAEEIEQLWQQYAHPPRAWFETK